MDREIQDWVTKVQARGPAIRRAPGFRVVVDQARIPRADLQIALANARHDPDGQQFPWRPEALSQNPVRTG